MTNVFRQQLPRKRHIGNDIVTVVFQVGFIWLQPWDHSDCLIIPGTWCSSFHSQHSLPVPACLHYSASTQPLLGQHSVQVGQYFLKFLNFRIFYLYLLIFVAGWDSSILSLGIRGELQRQGQISHFQSSPTARIKNNTHWSIWWFKLYFCLRPT